ncbi:MAG: hypothetical protein ACRC4M_03075 [Mycoplasma sp.]
MSSIYLITFLGLLFGMRLVLGLFGVPIVGLGFKISFAWLPIYICGFFYGPVIGLIFGVVMDTVSFAIFGGVWFWLYAIQEPIVGLVSGIVGSMYFLEIIKSIKWQVVLQKIFIYSFIFFTVFIIAYEFYILEDAKFSTSGLKNLSWFPIIVFVLMGVFAIINEVQSYLFYKKNKTEKSKNNYSLYLYLSFLMIFTSVLFSFLLGPIGYVKYLEYVNGVTPSNYLKYGNMFYLVPRVLKESIKTPLYILIMYGSIFSIKNPFRNFINISMNRW